MFGDLLRPFGYLTIRHESSLPVFVNWVFPGVFAIACILLGKWPGVQVQLLGDTGLVNLLLGFIQTLTGFYLAALAAMATFNNAGMDEIMPGKPPEITVKYNGTSTKVLATRRRFLCSMFAYLTVFSFLFTLFSIAVLSAGAASADLLVTESRHWFRLVFVFAYLFAVAHMTFITMWGLFYIGERVHTPG